ncbi:MAG: ATP-binding protein [Nitrospirota bacterium]|nr:ATP-binding protein [Nitrospirota bacterium]
MKKEYRLTIDLATLEHLGIGLYSNIPAVLSEVVANAWDADAKVVDINIDTASATITVSDDGWGMTEAEINDRFLKVGYRKREDKNAQIPKGRLPMGRKGIGKLALFSIANTIEVHSVKLDKHGKIVERNGFVMSATDIESEIRKQQPGRQPEYKPDPLPENRIKIKKGTLLTLRDLKIDANVTESFLRRRLARRFSVIGKSTGFNVRINDKSITVEDRDYFGKLEYIWFVGEKNETYLKQGKTLRHETLSGTVDGTHAYEVSGWVGTMAEHKNLEEVNNGIVILARGKVIHENILPDLKEGRVFSKYLIGELRADFLDRDDLADIATSDRQSVKESDSRYRQLKTFVKDMILNHIGNVWTDWRNEDKGAEALKNPAIDEWFKTLNPRHKKFAKKLLGKIASFPVQDQEFRKTLYQHGILAFETLAAKDNLDVLDKFESHEDLQRLIEIFKDIDELEAAHYWHITKTRVAVLQKFEKIAPKERETVIRDYIFAHLWLLDPSWERASTDKRMEEAVTKDWKKLDAGLTKEEKRGRIDIRYRTAAGKHIILELKKYDRKVQIEELTAQVRKYMTALEKCLAKAYPDVKRHSIETICILGDRPEPTDYDDNNRRMLEVLGARYITYEQLIRQTRESYADYLDKNQKISRIQQLVNQI